MKLDRFLYLSPRFLGILYAGFLALFALDVFIPGYSFVYYTVAFFIHLIPNIILGVLLYLSWRNDKLGIVLFSLAFLVAYFTYSGDTFEWSYLLLFSPLLIISVLFSIDETFHESKKAMSSMWLIIAIFIFLLILVIGLTYTRHISTFPKVWPFSYTKNNIINPISEKQQFSNLEEPTIIIISPSPNQALILPIIIEGRVKDIEGDLKFRLKDSCSITLIEEIIPVKAVDEGEYSKFNVKINSLPKINCSRGMLEIFEYSKSGAEISKLVSPILFDLSNTSTIKVFFGRTDATKDCSVVFETDRLVPAEELIEKTPIIELLKGPLKAETDMGYFTGINQKVQIQNFQIDGYTARIDFSKNLEENVGGSCRVTLIRSQINETMKQFPNIKEVIISIDGQTEDILQP